MDTFLELLVGNTLTRLIFFPTLACLPLLFFPKNEGGHRAVKIYTLAVLAGAATWGRAWLQRGEAFAVYFSFLASMAPLFRAVDGTVRVRPQCMNSL